MATKLEQLEAEHKTAQAELAHTRAELDAAREAAETLPGVRERLAEALQKAESTRDAARQAAKRNQGNQYAALYNDLLLSAEAEYERARTAFAPYATVEPKALEKNVVAVEQALEKVEKNERAAYNKVSAVREAETIDVAKQWLTAYSKALDVLAVGGPALARLDGADWWKLMESTAPDRETFLSRIQDQASVRRWQDDIKELAKRLA